jgi:glycosyltransferase involved in cell wall biosynthesis
MKVLIVHPVMGFLGGGERLCCETARALLAGGHEITMLAGTFNVRRVEQFFGYEGLFDRVNLLLYPLPNRPEVLGSTAHIIQHLRGQNQRLKEIGELRCPPFDLLFSTQDPGYIPNIRLPVVQWGYFPRIFATYPANSIMRIVRTWPLRTHYRRQISRIGMVLAISKFSKVNLDREWKHQSVLVYPACNMVDPGRKRDLVVTVARAIPEKRLELFWELARQRPQYEFVMVLTQDQRFRKYAIDLSEQTPENGKTVLDAPREMYQEILGEARVYIHLMEREHFGITIVEAMSASCVPIVHDSGGPKEIVEDGTGFRWRNIDDVPEMIDEAMKMSPSTAARHRAHDFNIERFGEKLSSLFSGLRQ